MNFKGFRIKGRGSDTEAIIERGTAPFAVYVLNGGMDMYPVALFEAAAKKADKIAERKFPEATVIGGVVATNIREGRNGELLFCGNTQVYEGNESFLEGGEIALSKQEVFEILSKAESKK